MNVTTFWRICQIIEKKIFSTQKRWTCIFKWLTCSLHKACKCTCTCVEFIWILLTWLSGSRADLLWVTHFGPMTQMIEIIIGSISGLTPIKCQVITWTSDDSLSVGQETSHYMYQNKWWPSLLTVYNFTCRQATQHYQGSPLRPWPQKIAVFRG